MITLLISEKMRIVGTSSNGGSQESVFYSTINKGRSRGGKTSFRGRHRNSHLDIINMKVKIMEVDEKTLEEKEVVEVVVEIIEVNNQITTQTTTITTGNLSTWQKIVIKRIMMHEMESCNKGIMHQLVIKVMSNCL